MAIQKLANENSCYFSGSSTICLLVLITLGFSPSPPNSSTVASVLLTECFLYLCSLYPDICMVESPYFLEGPYLKSQLFSEVSANIPTYITSPVTNSPKIKISHCFTWFVFLPNHSLTSLSLFAFVFLPVLFTRMLCVTGNYHLLYWLMHLECLG